MDQNKLFEIKQKIEEAKADIANLNGQMQALMKQLEDEFGCTSIKEAESKLKKIDEEIDKIDKEIEKGMKELSATLEVKTKGL